MKQKGLGRGLGALIDDFSEVSPQQQAVTVLPLQKVEPNPRQPRRTFDEVELQALADSIAEHGIVQPLAVRALENGYYQIIAGERRWRAARLAGLKEVPVVVLDADDQTVMELALIENLQRQDLNPMEEAEGYRSLIEDYGLTQEQAASRVGKSRPARTPCVFSPCRTRCAPWWRAARFPPDMPALCCLCRRRDCRRLRRRRSSPCGFPCGRRR